MLVMKFGGTSVKDAAALTRVTDIVKAHIRNHSQLLVVLSATAGTTNRLLDAAEQAVIDDESIVTAWRDLVDYHATVARGLIKDDDALQSAIADIQEIGEQLHTYLTGMSILQECTDQSRDTVASFGERWSTTVYSHALRAAGVDAILFDAADVVRTNAQHQAAVVDLDETERLCKSSLVPALEEHQVVVTQGFIGSTSRGIMTTLGRGGSDASAAIFGAVLDAEEIKIWTDVSGVYSADPRIVAGARPVPTMSFGEMRELALYGAKVLHPDAIAPAVKRGVPVHVCNTFAPDDPGTVITSNAADHGDIHAVSIVRDCQILNGSNRSVPMSIRTGNIARRLLLESSSVEHAMAVVHVPDGRALTDVVAAVAGQDVDVRNVALVIATGPKATSTASLERMMGALRSIPVLHVCSGISVWSTFVIVQREFGDQTVHALHDLTY